MGAKEAISRKIADTRFGMAKATAVGKLEKAVKEKKCDEMLVDFLTYFNSKKDYYTSSSCAGRILLLSTPSNKKLDAGFVFKEHRTVKAEEILKALRNTGEEKVWLKAEPFIFHLGARTLDNARKLLEVKLKAGVRRGGIMIAKEGKYLLEFVGSQYLSVPVKDKGKEVFSEKELSYLVGEANKKVSENYSCLERFMEEVRKGLE